MCVETPFSDRQNNPCRLLLRFRRLSFQEGVRPPTRSLDAFASIHSTEATYNDDDDDDGATLTRLTVEAYCKLNLVGRGSVDTRVSTVCVYICMYVSLSRVPRDSQACCARRIVARRRSSR